MYASPYVYVVYNALVYASKVQLNNLTEEAGLDNIVVTVIVCSDNIPKTRIMNTTYTTMKC